jgi:hypothetical protein
MACRPLLLRTTFLRGMHHVAHAKDPTKNPLCLDSLNAKHQCWPKNETKSSSFQTVQQDFHGERALQIHVGTTEQQGFVRAATKEMKQQVEL